MRVSATFFVPGVTALLHPDEQRRLVAEGHEVGLHGWIHEVASKLTPEEERSLILRSADTLEQITGRRPTGMRAPSFEISRDTLLIAEAMGLSYDASLMGHDDPHEIVVDGARAVDDRNSRRLGCATMAPICGSSGSRRCVHTPRRRMCSISSAGSWMRRTGRAGCSNC